MPARYDRVAAGARSPRPLTSDHMIPSQIGKAGVTHIGIVAEPANSRAKSGIEHYAKQLVLALARIDHFNRYTLYLRHEPEPWLRELPGSFELKVIRFPLLWTQLRVSSELVRHPVAVLFVPAQSIPIVHPHRTVVTLHDTNFLDNPETDTIIGRRYLQWSFRRVARKAWRIIAVSESTRNDLLRLFPASAGRVSVVHHGYEDVDAPEPSSQLAATLPPHYVLFLSTVQPRKNLVRLIHAFADLKRRHPELPHKLVVAGSMGWKSEAIAAAIAEHPDEVVYIGHVSDADRLALYRGADLFVLPSLSEGFGLGVLEAFRCGVPAAVSNVASLREIAADGALYFDPLNERDIGGAILRALTDEQLRQTLVARGRERLTHFSWERCARETLAVLTDQTSPDPSPDTSRAAKAYELP